MRAVVVDKFGDESVLNVKEIADPEPGPSQILVSVKAAGINPVDTYIRSGNYLPSRLPKLPYTPGGDVCGVVEAVGADEAVVLSVGEVSGRIERQGSIRWIGVCGDGERVSFRIRIVG